MRNLEWGNINSQTNQIKNKIYDYAEGKGEKPRTAINMETENRKRKLHNQRRLEFEGYPGHGDICQIGVNFWLTSVSVWVRLGFWFWFAKCHQTINKREVASTGKKEREVKGRRTSDETGTGTGNWPLATGDNIRVRLLGDYM